MRILIGSLFAIFTINNSAFLHESISASFNLIEKGHVLMLEIDFDEENFIKFGETNSLHVSKEDFSTYLHKTTSWYIDGKELVPQILDIKPGEHHTKVICFLSKKIENIKSVTVKNEFLLNVASHLNIVKLNLNNTYSGFELDKKKIEIKVDY